jgi:hypothetical protein
VVFWLPHLVLEVTLSGYDILLDRAVRFLIIVVVTGGNYNPLGTCLTTCLGWCMLVRVAWLGRGQNPSW